jgi:thiamine pyrophosphate-dependent acetolactate synthase large subunit-like protein
MTLRLNGAQALIQVLEAEGISNVYGIVGGKLSPLLHAISQSPHMHFLGTRHEGSAPMMAAATYAGTGKMAVAMGEMGPGGLNLISGLGVAFNNNLPLLAITTNQHRAASYPHSGMFMDLDTIAVSRPITKWNAVVHDARRMPELVRRALREALSGRPGPVHLDIPQDVLEQVCDFASDEFLIAPHRYRSMDRPRADAQAIAASVELLRNARRPLIVAGGGVVHSGASDVIQQLAQTLHCPIIPTQMALGVVASDSPYFVGHGGIIAGSAIQYAFQQADVILSVGCRWSSWMWDEAGPLARRSHRTIAINIDTSSLGGPVLHEVSMQADAQSAIHDILDVWPVSWKSQTETDWLDRIQQKRWAYETEKLTPSESSSYTAIHPAALAHAVAKALPPSALCIYDGGHTSFWSNDITPVSEVRSRFHEPGMSHLGFGLPYALALKTTRPDRPVVLITGDGSFGFTMNELDTARRYGLPVIVIIHNNETWGIIREGQKNSRNFELGTSLTGSDYAAIARGFGCHGERVEELDAFAAAYARSVDSGLPAVIDCRTVFLPHPCVPMFGSMNRYGFNALTPPALP